MPCALTSMIWFVLNRPLAEVIAWKIPESSLLTFACLPSPDSVEMVMSAFSRIVLPLGSIEFLSVSLVRK